MTRFLRRALVGSAMLAIGAVGEVKAAPDPTVMSYKLPDQIEWKARPEGVEVYVMWGDPSKAGPYALLVKWLPHHMSQPHTHPNARYITVLKGTWWVGTGEKFDPDNSTPMPAGSFVTHFAKQVHWDGAKDEECILEIVGEGPAPTDYVHPH